MQVILLEKIENLGDIGDQVSVRPGFGRNYLLPQGKATIASKENIALFEAKRTELLAKQEEELSAAQSRAAQFTNLAVSITAKVGSEGKLFGSLGTVDIAEACTAEGVELQRSEVRLPDGPLRTVGQHEVELHLHSDVNVTITINVVGEAGEELPDPDADGDAESSADNIDESGDDAETPEQ
jgi:large subunit ribosomal protein L9